MKKTIFMAATLAAAALLVAGLTVFPGSVQKAQANPCSVDTGNGPEFGDSEVRFDCEFNGHLEIEEEQSICVFPCVTETADATETGIMDNPLFNLADVDVFDELD